MTAITGFGHYSSLTKGYSVELVVKSRISNFTNSIQAIITSRITDQQPIHALGTDSWNIPSNVHLADPFIFVSQRIDLLIGASLFFELLCVDQIQLKTHLGWMLSGGGQQVLEHSSFIANDRLPQRGGILLDELVVRFCEIEHVTEPNSRMSKEELQCEEHFKRNYIRLQSEVTLHCWVSLTCKPKGVWKTSSGNLIGILTKKLPPLHL